jgi:hypothetical protein
LTLSSWLLLSNKAIPSSSEWVRPCRTVAKPPAGTSPSKGDFVFFVDGFREFPSGVSFVEEAGGGMMELVPFPPMDLPCHVVFVHAPFLAKTKSYFASPGSLGVPSTHTSIIKENAIILLFASFQARQIPIIIFCILARDSRSDGRPFAALSFSGTGFLLILVQ